MPSVAFALRSDARTKPGGDSSKIARYAKKLESIGWQTQTVTHLGQLDSLPDIVHITNLDLPRENLLYVREARRLGARVVLSTIRHPLEGIRAMYRSGADTMYAKTRRLGMSAEQAVGMRERLKLASRRQFAAAMIPGQYLALQAELLKRVDAFLPMASGEAEAIQRDFGLDSGTIIRNGYSFSRSGSDTPSHVIYDVISVGRIEPRKNSLALAHALHQSKVHGAFLGAINDKHARYARDFRRMAEASPYVTHLERVPHDQVPATLASARVYVNPAWFEVASQADVEAATVGLPVVTTIHGYAQDSLGHNVATLDPEHLVQDPRAALEQALHDASPCYPATDRDWDQCGIELDAVYREVLAS